MRRSNLIKYFYLFGLLGLFVIWFSSITYDTGASISILKHHIGVSIVAGRFHAGWIPYITPQDFTCFYDRVSPVDISELFPEHEFEFSDGFNYATISLPVYYMVRFWRNHLFI